MDPARPRVGAVALSCGKISACGEPNAVLALREAQTEVVELGGRLAMPGLVDGHAHPTKGALAELFSCKFPFSAEPSEIAEAVTAFIASYPGDSWVVGGRFGSGFFERNTIASPRAWLDGISEGRPVYLRDDSGHNGWANTEALVRLGIDRRTVDPIGGRVARDGSGEPTGLLLEQADADARAKIPDWSADQYRAAVIAMTKIANRFGITGVVDAYATEPLLRAYHAVDASDDLTLYVTASLSTPFGHRETPLDYERLEALRDRYASSRVDTRFAKIYQDGVPTGARTAAMLEPYLPAEGQPDGFRGQLHVGEEVLSRDIAELERRGFTVKLHTAGDRSVRVALDAIEAAHGATGRRDLRHELAHAGLIDPLDLPRFAALNVVADLSPYLWHPSPVLDSIRSAIGPRADCYWPIRSLLESGAPLLAGSDWPAAVASMDPWVGIEAMVTRRDPTGQSTGALGPEQALTLEETLAIFTRDGARAMRREEMTGSIEVGKSADLIVLDRDLFAVPPTEISASRVDLTFFEGEIVYRRPGS